MDCSPPGSSVHGILQARILEWVAMPSSGGSSHPRDQTQAPVWILAFSPDLPASIYFLCKVFKDLSLAICLGLIAAFSERKSGVCFLLYHTWNQNLWQFFLHDIIFCLTQLILFWRSVVNKASLCWIKIKKTLDPTGRKKITWSTSSSYFSFLL